MPWVQIAELFSAGALAGVAGAVARIAHPRRRRLGKCVLWEFPSACLLGSAGFALGGLLEFNEYGRFLIGMAFGYLGVAAIHDLVVSLVSLRMKMSKKDVDELIIRQSSDKDGGS
jgi:hypothetical protein